MQTTSCLFRILNIRSLSSPFIANKSNWSFNFIYLCQEPNSSFISFLHYFLFSRIILLSLLVLPFLRLQFSSLYFQFLGLKGYIIDTPLSPPLVICQLCAICFGPSYPLPQLLLDPVPSMPNFVSSLLCVCLSSLGGAYTSECVRYSVVLQLTYKWGHLEVAHVFPSVILFQQSLARVTLHIHPISTLILNLVGAFTKLMHDVRTTVGSFVCALLYLEDSTSFSHHHIWLLFSFLPSFHSGPWALEGKDGVQMIYLELSILQALILCTVVSCGSLS